MCFVITPNTMLEGRIVWNRLHFQYKSDMTPASWHHPAPSLLPLPQNRHWLLQSIVGLRIIHSGMQMQVGGRWLLCRHGDAPSGGHGTMCRISKGLTSQRWFRLRGQKGRACRLAKIAADRSFSWQVCAAWWLSWTGLNGKGEDR